MRWAFHLFTLEIRKLLSYRVDFWVSFLGGVLTEMVIAFFLWKAVYDSQGGGAISGYSFRAMILYYLLVALSRPVVNAITVDFVASEIYQGTLNRYLVYPVSFTGYTYVRWMANAWVNYLRLAVCFAIFLIFFGFPSDRHPGVEGLVLGSVALWGASSLYFVLSMIMDLVAFWADNVWSLEVMLRFTASLLGGAFIPLALFPTWSKPILAWMPFQYLFAFPIRCVMGEVGLRSWAIGMVSLALWCAVFSGIAGWVWNRGTRQYSGVGI